ncbi:hypothetical protein ACSSS7_001519 [Eimeria intestinalis]
MTSWWSAPLWLSFAYTGLFTAALNISVSVGSAEGEGTTGEGGWLSDEPTSSVQATGPALRVRSQTSGSGNSLEMKHGHASKHAHGALAGDAPPDHLSRLSAADVPSEPASRLTHAALPANENLGEQPSFIQQNQSETTILVLVTACIVLFLIVVGIITHYALSLRARSRRGGVRDAKEPYDGLEESNRVESEPQGETYESLPTAPPPASLESFNSLYNLPPGFIERKTPREIEYERRVMSRLVSHGDAPPTPRSQGRHLAPNADAAGFDGSANR